MVTYYTALGRMITKNENGAKVPIIIIEDTEYSLGVDELIIWGVLHWSFMDKDALEREYSRRKTKNRIFNDVSFEQTLNRLEVRGLVISATDYLAVDALYGLIGTLKIKPVRISVTDRIKSMLYMYFVKGLTLKESYFAYFGTKITANEKNVLKLSQRVGITASEIIKCAEKDIKSIKDEDDIMDKLYDEEDETYETLANRSRFSTLKTDVVRAVVNLYLKRKIIFEN